MTTMKNNQNDLPTLPQNPQGCSGHSKHPQELPPDDDADFGPLRTYIIVPRSMFWFFVILALSEGVILFWIFRHLAGH